MNLTIIKKDTHRMLKLLRGTGNVIKGAQRHASSTTKQFLEKDLVFAANSGDTIVCWHPERDIPYESTKPIQLTAQETKQLRYDASTPLRRVHVPRRFRNSRLEVEFLARITNTTKHRWYPQPVDHNPPRPVDRDGL